MEHHRHSRGDHDRGRAGDFFSLEILSNSKTTCREQDHADLARLRDLLELKRQREDATN